jgi:hypothetical protein
MHIKSNMSTFVRPPTDFTVVREDWCRYDLANNSILKVKIILTKVFRVQGTYSADFQHVVVVLTNERGTPDTHIYSASELQSSIVQDDIRFTTISQDWNEYVTDDGTRIKIQPMIMKVSKTSKFDARGEPQYWVEVQGTVQAKPPTPSV